MGTYLSLELTDKKNQEIKKINELWNAENPRFEDTLHFNTVEDIQADVDAIHTDAAQQRLRYINTVEDWNKEFKFWAQGCFQVKLTGADYLCSEMACRYVRFISGHRGLFRRLPDKYEMEILEEISREEHRAEECLVSCPFCAGTYPKRRIEMD